MYFTIPQNGLGNKLVQKLSKVENVKYLLTSHNYIRCWYLSNLKSLVDVTLNVITVMHLHYSSILGGMALQGNPLKCSCENSWLAKWLLRWMRETLQLHTSVVERGQSIQSIVRKITCQV